MKWLLYGNGWIGSQVFKCLSNDKNNLVVFGKSRVDNKKTLKEEITNFKPDRVISLIGRTHGENYTTIDYLELPGKIKDNVRDNLFSPVLLATICNNLDIHFTYLGTGCIFNYDSIHTSNECGFSEESEPNFFGSSYSVVKGYTDRLMHLFDNTLNVRIRMPITDCDSPRNFINKIISYEKICSIKNSMTVLPELIPIMLDMARNKDTGTINLTNPGVISHNEILTMYRDIVDSKFTWKNFSIQEQNKILLSKRSNNYLDTTLLETKYPNVNNIQKSVENMMKSIKEKNLNRL